MVLRIGLTERAAKLVNPESEFLLFFVQGMWIASTFPTVFTRPSKFTTSPEQVGGLVLDAFLIRLTAAQICCSQEFPPDIWVSASF